METGYKISLKNVDNKSIDGLIYTDSAVTLAGATDKPRYDLLGYATKAAGNAVGFSNAGGDQIDGLNGGWSIKNADLPYGGVAGVLAYRTNGIDDYDGTYLRRDGSNSMTGDLLLGNNNIKNVNSLTADNYVASQNAYFQTLRTQAIYNAGDIYTDSLNAATVFAGVVNTNVVNSTNPNKDTIFGSSDKNTASGNLYSGSLTAINSVVGNVLLANRIVNANEPCDGFPSGSMAKDIQGKILSCQSGLWASGLGDGAVAAMADDIVGNFGVATYFPPFTTMTNSTCILNLVWNLCNKWGAIPGCPSRYQQTYLKGNGNTVSDPGRRYCKFVG